MAELHRIITAQEAREVSRRHTRVGLFVARIMPTIDKEMMQGFFNCKYSIGRYTNDDEEKLLGDVLKELGKLGYTAEIQKDFMGGRDILIKWEEKDA